jgi:hypothetical protein
MALDSVGRNIGNFLIKNALERIIESGKMILCWPSVCTGS